MVYLDVPVSMLTKQPGKAASCVEVMTVRAEDSIDLAHLETLINLGYGEKGSVYKLTHRGNPISPTLRLTHINCSATEFPSFSALYDPCDKSQAAADHQRVHAKLLSGKTVGVDCNLQGSVGPLMRQIANVEGMPMEDLRVMHQGRQLEDGQRLSHYSITKGSTLQVSSRLLGGHVAAVAFVDISNDKALRVKAYGKAPRWRHCQPGLNIIGICHNRKCEAHQETVLDPVGMVSWSLLANKARCPICVTEFQPKNCCLTGCQWRYDGKKVKPDNTLQSVRSGWNFTPEGGHYHTFDAEGNMVQWFNLMLTVRPKSKEDECPVCYLPCTSKDDVVKPCDHSFHRTCLTAWKATLRRPVSCPMCNKGL